MEATHMRRRVNIKEALKDPAKAKYLIDGATDFICKVEGIRQDSHTATQTP
jgi:hypothetical protein